MTTNEIAIYQKADMSLKNELMAGKEISHDDSEVFLDTIRLTVHEIDQAEYTIALTKTAIIKSILTHPSPLISHMKGVEIKKLANCSPALISKTVKENDLELWTKEKEVIRHIEHNGGDKSPAEIAKELNVDPKTVRKALNKLNNEAEEVTTKSQSNKVNSKEIIQEQQDRIEELEEEVEDLSYYKEEYTKLKEQYSILLKQVK